MDRLWRNAVAFWCVALGLWAALAALVTFLFLVFRELTLAILTFP